MTGILKFISGESIEVPQNCQQFCIFTIFDWFFSGYMCICFLSLYLFSFFVFVFVLFLCICICFLSDRLVNGTGNGYRQESQYLVTALKQPVHYLSNYHQFYQIIIHTSSVSNIQNIEIGKSAFLHLPALFCDYCHLFKQNPWNFRYSMNFWLSAASLVKQHWKVEFSFSIPAVAIFLLLSQDLKTFIQSDVSLGTKSTMCPNKYGYICVFGI